MLRRIMAVGYFDLYLLLCGLPAFANDCTATADVANTSNIESNKYLFAFNVRASDCNQYGCHGFVHFAIKYHYPNNPNSVTDKALVDYRIPSGQSQTHISLDHWVGPANTPAQLDDVEVDDVTCSSL